MARSRNTADTQTASGGPVPPFTAGKNVIINGDFRFNQRNFTSISGSADTFGFDRFKMVSGGGATYTPQTFTPGSAPVAGYEAINFARVVTSGQSGTTPYTLFVTTIEDVRVLAGQTATLSFWAKSASGTPKIALEIAQGFGSGGSPSSFLNTYISQTTISTTWTRYSITFTMPSISGKTIGTTDNTSFSVITLWVSAGTDFNARTGSLGIQSNTFDFWGMQLEAGPTATPFETATGTIQGELAACQRYFQRIGNNAGAYYMYTNCSVEGSTTLWGTVPLPVTMRTIPSMSATSSGNTFTFLAFGNVSSSSIFLDTAQSSASSIVMGSNSLSGLTNYQSRYVRNLNDTTGTYISLSAEM
jgi:hypothetical protein